jgi:hypothetical protein
MSKSRERNEVRTHLLQGLVVYKAGCILGNLQLPLLDLFAKLPAILLVYPPVTKPDDDRLAQQVTWELTL